MRLAAPFGFYGAGNVGDEATLLGFAQLIQRFGNGLEVDVATSSVNHSRKVEPYFEYYPYFDGIMGWKPKLKAHLSQGYIFGGGTLISDRLGNWPLTTVSGILEHARNWGKPAAFVGIGVERLYHEASVKRMQDQIIPNTLAWSVRSPKDRERLLEMGVPASKVIVAADMAWFLEPVDAGYGRDVFSSLGLGDRPVIGVNVNAERHLLEKSPQLFTEMAAALDELIVRHGVQVLFLFAETRDGETYDKAASEKVRTLMAQKDSAVFGPSQYLIPKQMMSIISQCASTISTRYHFCLFSVLQNVPFLAVSRSDKVVDFCADINWPAQISPPDVSCERIVAGVERQMNGVPEDKARLQDKIAVMRARAADNQIVLHQLMAASAHVGAPTWLKHAAGRLRQKIGAGN